MTADSQWTPGCLHQELSKYTIYSTSAKFRRHLNDGALRDAGKATPREALVPPPSLPYYGSNSPYDICNGDRNPMTAASEFKPLNLAVLTISDTRGPAEDSSGQFLVDAALEAGHQVVARRILHDDIPLVRALVSRWIADPVINAVLITGGTGFHERDSTPEALGPLFEKTIEGFGEQFRRLSADEIGNSTIQSRALAGLANYTVVFCMPGSTGACRTAWNGIVRDQLNSGHKPCNFSALLHKKPERDLRCLDEPVPLDAARQGAL